MAVCRRATQTDVRNACAAGCHILFVECKVPNLRIGCSSKKNPLGLRARYDENGEPTARRTRKKRTIAYTSDSPE